jgi:hypothetical protein
MSETARDILSRPWLTGAVYCFPAALIVLSANVDIENRWRAGVWAVCLGVMAAGCVVNALRCGRMHCYFTGPFMILMGLASLSYGFGWLPLGINGWNWIGGVTLGGAVLLGCIPELLFGKYRRRC